LNEVIAEDAIEDTGPREFTVLYREDAAFGRYEPSDGAYIGAWLIPEMTIREFEHETGRSHAVYVYEIVLGEEIPVSWLLHCIASVATPLFIVHPPENFEDVSEIDLIIQLAQQLGAFNLPMFITFYPEGHGMMPAEYSLLFRNARNIFLTHAPMSAFVWTAPAGTSQNYYPGHSAVDWVAVSLLAEWKDDGFTDVLAEFDEFYNAFHENKPIMIFPFGVSHYSRNDYTYRVNQAADEISRLYDALDSYPRVGLIVYGDALTLLRAYSNDFSVSIESQLLNAYGNAIQNEYFLSSLERKTIENFRWVRSAYTGYFFEDEIYISQNTLQNELNFFSANLIEINENFFTEASEIDEKNIYVCYQQHVIYVDNLP
jgi:hypothetical protein